MIPSSSVAVLPGESASRLILTQTLEAPAGVGGAGPQELDQL
jgi:hypothetical protein